MPASIGVNLRVTGHCRQGGRKYMEDYFTVAYQQTDDEKDLEYAFFGIYDGHGGAEAAVFAKEHLMETIIRNKNFWSENDEDVLRAIKEGYVTTHYAMWKEQEKWPKTASGLPSTAGTTASVAFIRRGKIYIGHVGDSGIILGYQDPESNEWRARPLTRDHKPENADEMSRIKSCGGKVVAKSGVPRVVWNRPRIGHKGPVRRSTPIDEIPFLAVARSLGDLWSYNSALDRFVVSPDPDCTVVKIDTSTHRCLIFGTDGLYNMLSAQTAVTIVQQAEKHNEQAALSDYNKAWLNPSKLLVERALERWHTTKMRADNTSVITLMLDPPGPPKVLKLRKKASLPDSGLEIMTRYENNTQGDSCSSCRDDNKQPPSVGTEIKESETTIVNIENSENHPTNKEPAQKPTTTCLTETVPVTSSDNTSNYPLKERNFVQKTRESTSFDPREPRSSPDLSTTDKENQSSPSLDDTIQINEISSSSNDEENCNENVAEVSKHNLRSSSSRIKLDIKEDLKNRNLKRKLSGHESMLPRKSMRLGEHQKTEAKWPLGENKSKEDKPKSHPVASSSTSLPRLSITQKILKSKKMSFKKQSSSNENVSKTLSKENLERVFKEVLTSQKKPVAAKKVDKVDLPKFLRDVRATVLGGKFQRKSQRCSSLRGSKRIATGSAKKKVLKKGDEAKATTSMATRSSDPASLLKHSDKSTRLIVKSSSSSSSPNKKPVVNETKKPNKKSEKLIIKKQTLKRQIQQKTANLRKHVIKRK